MRNLAIAFVVIGCLVSACGKGDAGGSGACAAIAQKHLSVFGGEGYGADVRKKFMTGCEKMSSTEISCLDQHGDELARPGRWQNSPCCTAHAKILDVYFGGNWSAGCTAAGR
jgi:hypothetical protein